MTDQHTDSAPPRSHQGHSWAMIACCIPMLLIAMALVATGAGPPGLVFGAIACTLMMAPMMRGMDHDGHDQGSPAGHGTAGSR